MSKLYFAFAATALLAVSPIHSQIQNQPDDGQWTMPAKDFASTRYSTLSEINTGNVKNLKLAWTFSTGLTRGHEAAPLVVNNTMYVITPRPNLLYALDLTKPGAPRKWTYSRHPSPRALAELSQSGDQFFGIHASNHGRVMIFAGGIPLKRGGVVVGAIGVSGGMGKQDQAVAEAGAGTF